MYKCYIDSFDYHVYYPDLINVPNTPQNVSMIYIKLEVKQLFVTLYKNNGVINIDDRANTQTRN